MLARRLGLPVVKELIVVAIEVASCLRFGGEMHSEVRDAIPVVIDTVRKLIADGFSV